MGIPGLELVLGLALKAMFWLTLYVVGAVWRTVRSAIFDHPLLTALMVVAVNQLGWLAQVSLLLYVWLRDWHSLVAILLLLVAIARFVGEGGPAAIKRNARRTERMVRNLAVWTVAREWADGHKERQRIKHLPPPPLHPPIPAPLDAGPMAMGPVTPNTTEAPDADVQVDEVPDADVELLDDMPDHAEPTEQVPA